MITAINKRLDEIEKWFDDPAADIANITDVIPPLVAALRRAVEGLHGYQCDINSFPLNLENRGRHMDYCDKCKALSDVAEKLGVKSCEMVEINCGEIVLSREDLLQAFGQAYTSNKNAHKILDSEVGIELARILFGEEIMKP
jgi:hypothetical protein